MGGKDTVPGAGRPGKRFHADRGRLREKRAVNDETVGLSLSYQLNQDQFSVTGKPVLVYLLLETHGNGSDREGPPVNLGVVVDASYSMHIRLATTQQFTELAELGVLQEVMTDGVPSWRVEDVPQALLHHLPRKIDFVMEALRGLLVQLRPEDRLALVAFAGDAVTLLHNSAARNKDDLEEVIASLGRMDLGADTFMGLGMGRAHDEVVRFAGPDVVSRIILLTDGFTRDVSACWRWVEAAQAAGITVSTMGMGGEFNEDLLIPMSERSGGHAYFVEEMDAIEDLFREELAAVKAVTQRNVELKLRLTPGVELRRVHRVRPAINRLDPGRNDGGSYTLFLGDMERDSPPALLLELIVPSRAAGRFRIAEVLLSSDPLGAARQTVREDIVLTFVPAQQAAPPVNGRVMNLIERVSAFTLHTRALEDARAGDIAGATRKLQAAATRLLDMGETALGEAMSQQALLLAQGQQASENETKKLRYETRKLTQRLD